MTFTRSSLCRDVAGMYQALPVSDSSSPVLCIQSPALRERMEDGEWRETAGRLFPFGTDHQLLVQEEGPSLDRCGMEIQLSRMSKGRPGRMSHLSDNSRSRLSPAVSCMWNLPSGR